MLEKTDMPTATRARTAGTLRQKLFWTFITALVAAQLLAFWMLCSDQVRQAEAREAAVQQQRTVAASALLSRATPVHATPVNFTLR